MKELEGHFPYFYSPHFFGKDGTASAKWFRAASRSAEALSMQSKALFKWLRITPWSDG